MRAGRNGFVEQPRERPRPGTSAPWGRRRLLGIVAALWILPSGALSGAFAGPPDPIVEEARTRGAFVLAEFVSKTCPACDEMRPIVEALFDNHPDLRHQVHDADLEVALAKKYEVRCVPVYVVVDPQGEIRFNEVGMRTLEEMEQILREAGVPSR